MYKRAFGLRRLELHGGPHAPRNPPRFPLHPMRGVEVLEFSADWKTHGKSAGPMRNRQMLNDGQPTAVVAFPGGRGTADMIHAAKAVGLPVWEPVKRPTRPTVTPPSDIASS
jgi:hypothetical protein